MLATLTRPDGGRGLVAFHDVVREAPAARREIGYVSQQSGVDREATGRENLALQGHLYPMERRHLRRRVDELLEMLGLIGAASRLARGHSGGMRRRLDIAMGLVHEPRVLFLDEPTTGLNPESRAALWHDLTALRDQSGLSILLTTHDLEEADSLAECVAIIDHVRVVATGTPAAPQGGAARRQRRSRARGPRRRTPPPGSGRGLPGVVEASTLSGHLHVLAADWPAALPALVATLQQAGIEVRAANVARPSLDEVYLHHTGRAFSQAEAARGGEQGSRW
jgi:ABC-2 type transport system ATP-binding protein